ncbi:MAG: hypothetical protein JW885_15875 [Deltaproteobacteria bacterium]|nr:hypothetical protein [Candidatus Zymogenaceae bacterium]
MAFRKELYRSLEEIQVDLNGFMQYYSEGRTNQGKYCQGRTPRKAFLDGLGSY